MMNEPNEPKQPQEPPSGASPGEDTAAAREAVDRLSQFNRVLLEARMLPPSMPLTDEQIKAVVQHFREYIVEHNIKHRQAAREIDYAPSVIFDWMNGKYKGNSQKVTRAINQWLERDARRRQARRPREYVKTWVAEGIRTYVCLADKQVSMAVIVAPSGSGKTMVLQTLAEEMRALYVCCSGKMNLKALYLKNAKLLGWKRAFATLFEVESFLIEQLTGTGRMILIDEAHLLGPAIRALRSIHDQAQVPIVFCGTDEIEGAVDDRRHGRGQFASRCIYFNATQLARNVDDPDRPDSGRDLFSIEEIKQFFARSKIRLDRGGFKMAWALACLPGSGAIRLLERIIKCFNEAMPDAECYTKDDLIEAMSMIDLNRVRHLVNLAERHAERSETSPAEITAIAG